MVKLAMVEGDSNYVKDLDSGAVLATKRAYEEWAKSNRLDNKMSKLEKKVENLETAITKMSSLVSQLVGMMKNEKEEIN